MDFIQTFELDEELCDTISSRIHIPENTEKPCAVEADIEELYEHFEKFGQEYFNKIEEFNYFVDPDRLGFKYKMWINYIPPWTVMQWTSEMGDALNFYLFLKDTLSVIEFFNPFVRRCVRFQCRKGLVVAVPAAWLFIRRHTSTLHSHAMFVMGCASINDLNNMKES
jgi:acyl-ACP thioesterase